MVLGMSLSFAGLLLLMHGAPLVLIPLTHRQGETHHSDSGDKWSPKQQEKVAKFLRAYFTTKTELDHFMIEAGSILSAVGVGLMVLGKVVQNPKPEEMLPGSQSK